MVIKYSKFIDCGKGKLWAEYIYLMAYKHNRKYKRMSFERWCKDEVETIEKIKNLQFPNKNFNL